MPIYNNHLPGHMGKRTGNVEQPGLILLGITLSLMVERLRPSSNLLGMGDINKKLVWINTPPRAG